MEERGRERAQFVLYKLLKRARQKNIGLPPGVVSLVPGGREVGGTLPASCQNQSAPRVPNTSGNGSPSTSN